MSAYKRASFVGFVIAIFGIIIAVYGFKFLLERNDLQANGIKVKGKVIEIGQNGPMYRFPIVEFKTADGKKRVFKSRLEINHLMFKYVIGQEVDVIYHKNDVKNVEVDAFWEQNMPQIFLGSFGLFLMLLGLFLRWMFLRKARQYAS